MMLSATLTRLLAHIGFILKTFVPRKLMTQIRAKITGTQGSRFTFGEFTLHDLSGAAFSVDQDAERGTQIVRLTVDVGQPNRA